jgi:hypothetical protein
MSADDYVAGWDTEGDELVRRLSTLEWAPVPAELRERCWRAFEERIEQSTNGASDRVRSRSGFNIAERYEMRRFAPARRLAVSQAGRGLVPSARLAAAQVGRRHVPPRALSLG